MSVIGMAAATDEAILITAGDRNAVIVTLDADFSRVVSKVARKFSIGSAHPRRGLKGRRVGYADQ